jgi:hypothetical protein
MASPEQLITAASRFLSFLPYFAPAWHRHRWPGRCSDHPWRPLSRSQPPGGYGVTRHGSDSTAAIGRRRTTQNAGAASPGQSSLRHRRAMLHVCSRLSARTDRRVLERPGHPTPLRGCAPNEPSSCAIRLTDPWVAECHWAGPVGRAILPAGSQGQQHRSGTAVSRPIWRPRVPDRGGG